MANLKHKSTYPNLFSVGLSLIGIFIILQFSLCLNEVNGTNLMRDRCIAKSRLITHKPQGPICQCNRGFCLYDKPEGLYCIRDYSNRYNQRQNRNCNRSYNIGLIEPVPPTTTQQPVILPDIMPPRSFYGRSYDNSRQLVDTTPNPRKQCFGWDCNNAMDDYYDIDLDVEEITTLSANPNSQSLFNREDFVILGDSEAVVDGVYPPLEKSGISSNVINVHSSRIRRTSVLPRINGSMSFNEENCLKSSRVYWPHDNQCHTILQQGPCGDDEWLILKEGRFLNDDLTISCKKRPCPCRKSDSYLCEVLVPKKVIECGTEKEQKSCHVAMAAEQDGICDKGEQVIVTPLGDGICGCRKNPPHMTWDQDGKCYPMFDHGEPCTGNQSLQFSPVLKRAVCVATLCKPGFVLYEDGRCYMINSQGPCDDISKLGIDPKTYQLKCIPGAGSLQRSLWGLFQPIKGIRRLPQTDLSFLQDTPAECNPTDGSCLRLTMHSNNDMNMVIEDPNEIPCDEILCNPGYEVVEKPEGCQCLKPRPRRVRGRRLGFQSRLGIGQTTRIPIDYTRRNSYHEATTQMPTNLRLADEKAKKYLIWLHDFQRRRKSFSNKVMGRI